MTDQPKVLGHQSKSDDIAPGTPLRVRDASGRWLERRVAASNVEGCYDAQGHLIHDFAGVYVRLADAPEDDGLFWPLEDVEVVR